VLRVQMRNTPEPSQNEALSSLDTAALARLLAANQALVQQQVAACFSRTSTASPVVGRLQTIVARVLFYWCIVSTSTGLWGAFHAGTGKEVLMADANAQAEQEMLQRSSFEAARRNSISSDGPMELTSSTHSDPLFGSGRHLLSAACAACRAFSSVCPRSLPKRKDSWR
jgi:hypothetical protein